MSLSPSLSLSLSLSLPFSPLFLFAFDDLMRFDTFKMRQGKETYREREKES